MLKFTKDLSIQWLIDYSIKTTWWFNYFDHYIYVVKVRDMKQNMKDFVDLTCIYGFMVGFMACINNDLLPTYTNVKLMILVQCVSNSYANKKSQY